MFINEINTGFSKNGSISVIEENNFSSMGANNLSAEENLYLYISGQNDSGNAYIKQVNQSSKEEKIVSFDGIEEAPAAYPSAFKLDGIRYLLFGNKKSFELYKFYSSDEDKSYFISSNRWDFSNIENYLSDLKYKGDDTGWIMAPEYNNTLNTLYFTIGRWIYNPDNQYRKEYIKMRIYKSSLNNQIQFSEPTEVKGELDPYNGIYYKDGKERTIDDYPQGEGLFWLGRMYITTNGEKAYFTQITNGANEDMDFLKPGFPYITYNINTDEERITTILSADINKNGDFYNVKQLSSPINQGGVNFVCDISPDGSKLYVAHMKIEDDFFERYGWGTDGMILSLCSQHPWDVEPWSGKIKEILLEY